MYRPVCLTVAAAEIIRSVIIIVSTQTTRPSFVCFGHFEVDSRAPVPRQREAKRALHQDVVSQPLNENITYCLWQTQPENMNMKQTNNTRISIMFDIEMCCHRTFSVILSSACYRDLKSIENHKWPRFIMFSDKPYTSNRVIYPSVSRFINSLFH